MFSDSEAFVVKFWGVRGSIPSPGGETIRYGGNTPCVEMQVCGERLIFDAGTGIRCLGKQMMAEGPISARLFLSHYHWDHVQGFPFFEPAFTPENQFEIYGAIALDGSTVEQRLGLQMLHPNFPVSLQIMASNLTFRDLVPGDRLSLGNSRYDSSNNRVLIETALLNHPGGAVGYRVSAQGRSVVYATDTEHYPNRVDPNLLHLARQADVLIYDSTYTDDEYHSRRCSKVGWGHSTWQEAVKLAQAAGVKQLVIFHHDPAHNDDFLDNVAAAVQERCMGAVMAREGMEIVLQRSPIAVYSPVSPV
ncbi:MAG: MBL fold metallo-hydrolase [Synechococcales cyanobacterium RM1_1_8]|nr:MBL fold metallo-hydrolase [Synechococcales cyanobacterium RM1_1_8]